MAGIFGLFDFTKPGPGVPKDERPKPRIFLFFEVFFRKFWNLIIINMLFVLFNLPALIVASLVTTLIFSQNILPGDPSDSMVALYETMFRLSIGVLFVCIPVITVGPAQAGFTYILRNYARQEHSFIWSDFKEHALKNFKQSMIVSGIDLVVLVLMSISMKYYIVLNNGNILMSMASILMGLAFILYIMMHIYIYPMLVTFNLTIKQLYKNALIFAGIKFIPNFIILIICGLLVLFTFGGIVPFNPIMGIPIYFVLTASLIGFILNFYAYPKLEKYMIGNNENVIIEDNKSFDD
jgi:uncharacterized membrane protein YesL